MAKGIRSRTESERLEKLERTTLDDCRGPRGHHGARLRATWKRQVATRASSRMALAIIAVMLAALGALQTIAQTLPPERMNYQGVLRDQNGNPLTGAYDMVFRLMDAGAGGNEIWVDEHKTAYSNAVIVTGGLFEVALGTGYSYDGSGPDYHPFLSDVFRDYTNVWLEVQVGTETLSPRTQIQSTPHAFNAAHLGGRPDDYFLNIGTDAQSKMGQLSVTPFLTPGATAGVFESTGSGSLGLRARAETGGRFENDAVAFASYADLATTGIGVKGFGASVGGLFNGSANISGSVGVYGEGREYGIQAQGGTAGARFDGPSTGYALLAVGNDGGEFVSGGLPPSQTNVTIASIPYAIDADGPARFQSETSLGGWFTNSTAGVEARLADGGYGVRANGSTAGYFTGLGLGAATLGTSLGGHFTNGTSGVQARLADGEFGVVGAGPCVGGLFSSNSYGSYAEVPWCDTGIRGHGSIAGGGFDNFTTGAWGLVGYSSYKILGSGAVSFVQNHPKDPSKVIVYAAPEGDEVAVYTRGSARLVDGEARVALGGTFALVTNPDIGLTATATPRGEPIPLGVKQVTPTELVVQGPAGSDAEFDYMVWGLRIGFEEQSIVQPKQEEARIPSMHMHAQYFADDPALRGQTALARFQRIEASMRGKGSLDFSRSQELLAAIGVSPKGERPTEAGGPVTRDPAAPSAVPSGVGGTVGAERGPSGSAGALSSVEGEERAESIGTPDGRGSGTVTSRTALDWVDLLVAGETIEQGDVVSLSKDSPGQVVRSAGMDDALIIGCAQPTESATVAAEAGEPVAVASSRIALCRVDASYGPVSIGDRLIASPLPGMAMRIDAGLPGAPVLGRAIEPLDAGTALVRVLLGVK